MQDKLLFEHIFDNDDNVDKDNHLRMHFLKKPKKHFVFLVSSHTSALIIPKSHPNPHHKALLPLSNDN